MKNPQPTIGSAAGDGDRKYSEGEIAQISSRIRRLCLSRGLSRTQVDDVMQDIWLWLIRAGEPRCALSPGWILAVAQNFVLRYRRRSSRLRNHEETCLDGIDEPATLPDYSAIETEEILDRVSRILPDKEKGLLLLIRQGNTLSRAAALLKIPRGSRTFHRNRILDLARKVVQGSESGSRPRSLRCPNRGANRAAP
jgi:DNA-directed RNA polymerase specialized sigma24 family protein